MTLGPRLAAAEEFVHFDHLADAEVVSQVFRLSSPRSVHVECEGAGDAGDGADDEMYAYGWILDLHSREPVWRLTANSERRSGNRNFAFDGNISLPAGDYIAYYASYGDWRSRVKIIRFLGKEIGRIELDDGRKKRIHRDSSRWGLKLSTPTTHDAAISTDLPAARPDDLTIVQMTGVGDGVLEQKGVTLSARMQVTVYCVGEVDPDTKDNSDYGWILDARTRKRVWELGPDNYKHAGGARMNKYARETITLPAGDYIVCYASDAAHSAAGWKGPPPYDPDSWGITVWAVNADDARRVRPYTENTDEQSIVSLIRQGNNAYAEQGLTVTRQVQVRVYALGEFAGDNFADEGWVEESKTGRRVWEMTEDNTQRAGGAEKNRMADEILSLAPGDYVVRYQSDDSHAYQEWNARPPNDPSHWGISLMMARGGDRSMFKLFDRERRAEAGRHDLVRLVRLGDDSDVDASFRIDKPTRIHIVAEGEGVDEMVDYGWIEDKNNGNVVWEMTLRNTRHAGGAEKNRIFDGTILLDRGEYQVHFVTDGSHAWRAWNSNPPRNPDAWGITVTPEGTPAPR